VEPSNDAERSKLSKRREKNQDIGEEKKEGPVNRTDGVGQMVTPTLKIEEWGKRVKER